jgi:probable rRNA maturation factor
VKKPELYLKNRQRAQRVDLRLLRKIITFLLRQEINVNEYILGVHLVNDKEITLLNETHLQHAGATDVITFDYSEEGCPALLIGDVFICVEEAARQAGRYRTDWQTEVVRYMVHGILHLLGFDDQTAAERRKMKREEDRFVRKLQTEFSLARLGRSRN